MTRNSNPETEGSESYAVAFGRRFSDEMDRLGHTQAAFARLARISRLTVHNYATGQSTPSTEVLSRLVNAGVDVLFLLTGQRSGFIPLLERAALHKAFREAGDRLFNTEAMFDDFQRVELAASLYEARCAVTVPTAPAARLQ